MKYSVREAILNQWFVNGNVTGEYTLSKELKIAVRRGFHA